MTLLLSLQGVGIPCQHLAKGTLAGSQWEPGVSGSTEEAAELNRGSSPARPGVLQTALGKTRGGADSWPTRISALGLDKGTLTGPLLCLL